MGPKASFKLAFLRENANRIAVTRNPICVIYSRLLRYKIYKIHIEIIVVEGCRKMSNINRYKDIRKPSNISLTILWS
jgi:hypothetical protein